MKVRGLVPPSNRAQYYVLIHLRRPSTLRLSSRGILKRMRIMYTKRRKKNLISSPRWCGRELSRRCESFDRLWEREKSAIIESRLRCCCCYSRRSGEPLYEDFHSSLIQPKASSPQFSSCSLSISAEGESLRLNFPVDVSSRETRTSWFLEAKRDRCLRRVKSYIATWHSYKKFIGSTGARSFDGVVYIYIIFGKWILSNSENLHYISPEDSRYPLYKSNFEIPKQACHLYN